MSGSKQKLDVPAVVVMTNAGFPAWIIARTLGVTDRTIFRARRDAGVSGRAILAQPKRGPLEPRWWTPTWRAAMRVWRDGWSVNAAARAVRISPCGVAWAIRRLRRGIVAPPAAWLNAPPRPPKPDQAYRPPTRRSYQ